MQEVIEMIGDAPDELLSRLKEYDASNRESIREETRKVLEDWREVRQAYSGDELVYKVRNLPLDARGKRARKVSVHSRRFSAQAG